MRRWLSHPMSAPSLALVLGLIAAWLLADNLVVAHALHVELPPGLAAQLSEAADRDLVLAKPLALWVMPTAVLPYLVVMARRSLVDMRPVQVVLQLVARLAVLMALALAFASPSLESPIRGKSIVFVVDVSQSIDEQQRAAARDQVVEAWELVTAEGALGIDPADRTSFSLVTYAERARAIDLRGLTPAELRLDADPEGGLASDHAAGLRLGAALLDGEREGRIVLITDGTGDLAEREGLARTIASLEESGVTVHTRSFAAEARGDVLVDAVFLPDELRVGQSFEVAIDVVATSGGPMVVHLDEDGAPNPLAPSTTVELRPGRQQIKLPARVTRPGPVTFTAWLATEGLPPATNRSLANDRAAVVGEVRGRPRILLVGSDSTGALPRALAADHLQVDSVDAGAVPRSADGLRGYDLVVFSDVPARSISPEQQRALVHWVKELGGGFVMVGGENSFGVGGWGGTPLESILPVSFAGERQREQPTLALVLVIDKSGSMSSQDRLDLVKEAARATARTLDPSDELGVVAFDSHPQVLVRLQPSANRLRISSSIRRLSSGGGTNALPALREAYLQLSGSKALVKHVILLSDGESPAAGVDSLLGNMRDADITVSSVGVGSGAGKEFLARVAERGRGRYYFSQDGTDVPRIFSRETREMTKNALVERQLYPRVAKPAQVLRGIDFARAPGLTGIVPVKPKAQSELLLQTHLGDPLLVRGRRGLGRVAAFASDAKPRWAANWIGWSGFAKLWAQIARDTMRQGAGMLGGARIKVSPASDPGAWSIVVDVESSEGFANELAGRVRVIDPGKAEDDPEREREVGLALTAPGRYEGVVDEVSAGQRLLKASLYDESGPVPHLVAEAVAQVSVPYPAELAVEQLAPRQEWLATLTRRGSSEGAIDEVVTTPGDAHGRTRTKPLWPTVLLFLFLPLLLVDLALRRVSFGVRRIDI